jgi:hypothetical protein
VHFHSCEISGVLYLKTPRLERGDEGLQKTYISGRQAGYINFLIGGNQRFAKSLVSFRPRVSDFYVLPLASAQRRAISRGPGAALARL